GSGPLSCLGLRVAGRCPLAPVRAAIRAAPVRRRSRYRPRLRLSLTQAPLLHRQGAMSADRDLHLRPAGAARRLLRRPSANRGRHRSNPTLQSRRKAGRADQWVLKNVRRPAPDCRQGACRNYCRIYCLQDSLCRSYDRAWYSRAIGPVETGEQPQAEGDDAQRDTQQETPHARGDQDIVDKRTYGADQLFHRGRQRALADEEKEDRQQKEECPAATLALPEADAAEEQEKGQQ